MPLSDSDLLRMYLKLKVVICLLVRATVPTTTTTESATSWQLTIFGRPDEAVSNKKSRVPTKHELQQYAVPTKHERHHPRPQDANWATCKHCEPVTIGQVRQSTLTNNSESEGEYERSYSEKW
ncbi:hypothetical protein CR513_35054, partial [Mucuna pruriens]